MAVTATRTYEDYEKEQMDKALKQVNERAAAYKATSDDTLSQINKSIDDAAKTAAGVYQQRVDGAGELYKERYSDNAIDEAFAREQIKNSMAASGMTDSGKNLTMQAALSLQRNNRDAEVTADKQEYVQKLKDAIDAVRADAASQKSAKQIEAQQNYQSFYDNLYNSLTSSARSNAVDMYNADLATQQAAYEAEQERLAAERKAEYEAMLESVKAGTEANKELSAKRESYALNMMKNMEYTEEQAWAAAYAKYPSGDTATDTYYSAYNAAVKSGYTEAEAMAYAQAGGGTAGESAVDSMREKKALGVVGDLNVLTKNGMWDSFVTAFSNAEDDGEYVYKNVTKALENVPGYKNLNASEQEYAQAIALANTLSQHWASDLKNGKTNQMLRRLNGMDYAINDKQYGIIAKRLGLKIN